MHGFWTKVAPARGPLRSFVGWLAAQYWLACVLSAICLAGSDLALLLLKPSTKASGATAGASRMRTLARNNNEDDFASLGNNVSLCQYESVN